MWSTISYAKLFLLLITEMISIRESIFLIPLPFSVQRPSWFLIPFLYFSFLIKYNQIKMYRSLYYDIKCDHRIISTAFNSFLIQK